jgi:hypothetical protein
MGSARLGGPRGVSGIALAPALVVGPTFDPLADHGAFMQSACKNPVLPPV